jgi:hypothetical protein
MVLVCGSSGYFAVWEAGTWAEIQLPTNVSLFTISGDPEGRFVVAGERGNIYYGSPDVGFETLEWLDHDLMGSCLYKGELLLTAPGYGVVCIRDRQVIDFQKGPRANRLSSHGELLLLAEDDCILVYDGKNWPQLPLF